MVIVCLSGDQWKKLEPHLSEEGVRTNATEDEAFPMLDCQEIPDESTYDKVLEIARNHCPDLVEEIQISTRTSKQ